MLLKAKFCLTQFHYFSNHLKSFWSVFEGVYSQRISKSYPWEKYCPKLQELVASTWLFNEDPCCPEKRKADWVWNLARDLKDDKGEFEYSRFAIYLKKPDAIKSYFTQPGLVNHAWLNSNQINEFEQTYLLRVTTFSSENFSSFLEKRSNQSNRLCFVHFKYKFTNLGGEENSRPDRG